MPQLMRKHCFDFRNVQTRKQRVKKNDPFGFAETGEISITVVATARAIHHKKTTGFETTFSHQLFNARFERRVSKRRKFVENRRDPGREYGK